MSSQSEQQWASNKDNKVILVPLSQFDISFVVMVALGNRDQEGKGDREERSEVLLPSLLGIHGIQDGLPFGGVALPELLNLPLHHGIQGTQAHLQLLKVQVLQLGDSTQTETQTSNNRNRDESQVVVDNTVRTASVLLFLTTEALAYIPLGQSSTISTVNNSHYNSSAITCSWKTLLTKSKSPS